MGRAEHYLRGGVVLNSLLSKFESVEMSTVDLINEEDMKYCETQFNFYTKVYRAYAAHLEIMVDLEKEQDTLRYLVKDQIGYSPTYVWSHDGISSRQTKNAMKGLTEGFVESTCSYFDQKYSITTNKKALRIDEYSCEPVYYTLDEILKSCVIGELDGLSFIEKAIQEMRDKAKTERYYNEYRDEWNYDVKSKTIKFRFGIGKIMPALYFYDNAEQEILNHYTFQRIEDFRSFGNGNTDIKFKKPEYALEFARKYLGYVAVGTCMP